MSQVNEIKCSVCGKRSRLTNKIEDRCPNCYTFLDPVRFHYVEEIRFAPEWNKKNTDLAIKDTHHASSQMLKQFTNWLRWGTFYGISVLYFIIAALVVLFGLAMF